MREAQSQFVATKGNQNARKEPAKKRVILRQQRVKPETLDSLKRMAPTCGGVGRAIDHITEKAAT